MSLKMNYEMDNVNCQIEIKSDEATLTEIFAHFVEMTRIMQYHPDSWKYIIEEIYKYCVLHEDARSDYDIFEWAQDALSFV